ncbi:hypothetical protein D3C75_998380 [compost metagenome]
MVVQVAEGQHDRHRQHRAGQGVAQVGQANPGTDAAGRRLTPGKCQQQCDAHRDQGCQGAQVQGVQHQANIALVQVMPPPVPEPYQQLQQRDDEGTGKHQQAPATGQQCLQTAQVIEGLTPRAFV